MYWEKLGRKESRNSKVSTDEEPAKLKINLPIRVVYVWALVFLGMVLYVFVWFSMGIAVMTFVDSVVATFNFGDPWDSLVTFVRNLFLFHPIISLIGWLIYGIINSMRRDVESWRTY